MKIHIECLPCILNQAIEASKMSTNDENLIEDILVESIKMMEEYKTYCCTPDITQKIHDLVKDITGNTDPYKQIKEKDIKSALKLYPYLEKVHAENGNSLHSALKISATGNIIDSAIYTDLDIEACIEEELNKPFGVLDLKKLEEKLIKTGKILIIGDNSGETVFDKILAQTLPLDIIYAVRETPIINDATLEEAHASGLDSCTTLISSGSKAPGTILERCSEEFKEIFYESDIVISKGQGNYESLSDCDRDIFFLLKAKCEVVALDLNVDVGEYVFKYKA